LLLPAGLPTPVAQRRLPLVDALFDADVIIFDRLQSRSVTYGAGDGPRLQIGYPDAPYLGIWTKPGAGFICIEPWHGVADPEEFSGDFTAKPGIFMLAPGATLPIRMTVTLL
jgi:galactose mutarotase-like enzyme